MDSLKVSLLKCTTASETLVMHRTTFYACPLYNHASKATFQNSDLYHATDDTILNSSGSSFRLRNKDFFPLIAQLTSTHT